MNRNIKDYLDYYIKLENPQFSILLNGKWGSGKTYFIKRLLEEWKIKEKSDEICIKPIYISLNGIDSVEKIQNLIRKEINPFLYSKGVKIAKKVLLGLIKSAVKIDLDFNGDEAADAKCLINIDPLDVFSLQDTNVKNDRIIVFDDIERCKIGLEEVFGYINNFVEQLNCKVILVCNEDEIESQLENGGKVYNKIKEKIIGHSFKLHSEVDEALISFSKELNNPEIIIKNKDLIINIFNVSKIENLRSLRLSLHEFIRFEELLSANFQHEDNYNSFIKHVLVYFLIVNFEYRSGNRDVSYFQNNFIRDEELQKKIVKFDMKYRDLIIENEIYNSNYLFDLKYIVFYIENGYWGKRAFCDVKTKCLFFKDETESGWNRLWYWKTLEQKEFEELYIEVWQDLQENKIVNVFEVFHICGIYLDIIKNKMSKKREETVLKLGKRNIKRIMRNANDYNEYRDIYNFNDSYGKAYLGKESSEFKELIIFFKDEQNMLKERLYINIIQEIFYKIDDSTSRKLSTILSEINTDGQMISEHTPFFKYIEGKKFGRILKYKNANIIYNLRYFISKRYFNNDGDELLQKSYLFEEKEFLLDFKKEIDKKSNIKDKIVKYNLTELGKVLKKIEEKMKGI